MGDYVRVVTASLLNSMLNHFNSHSPVNYRNTGFPTVFGMHLV